MFGKLVIRSRRKALAHRSRTTIKLSPLSPESRATSPEKNYIKCTAITWKRVRNDMVGSMVCRPAVGAFPATSSQLIWVISRPSSRSRCRHFVVCYEKCRSARLHAKLDTSSRTPFHRERNSGLEAQYQPSVRRSRRYAETTANRANPPS